MQQVYHLLKCFSHKLKETLDVIVNVSVYTGQNTWPTTMKVSHRLYCGYFFSFSATSCILHPLSLSVCEPETELRGMATEAAIKKTNSSSGIRERARPHRTTQEEHTYRTRPGGGGLVCMFMLFVTTAWPLWGGLVTYVCARESSLAALSLR